MDQVKMQIIKTGQFVMEKQLTWGTSGNISARVGDRVYITASGTTIGDLQPEDIIVCDLTGKVLEGDKKPSKETQMHLEVYRSRPEIGGVLHASPFYSTFCSCCGLPLKTDLFIEAMYYDEGLLSVPYCHAGSQELADAVGAVCRQTHTILLAHHGVLVYDTDLKECATGLEITENLCKMNILAHMGNLPLQELPGDTVREFREGGYFKKRRL